MNTNLKLALAFILGATFMGLAQCSAPAHAGATMGIGDSANRIANALERIANSLERNR